jgi:hypothetical protein
MCASIFLVCGFVDYGGIGDIFRQGKIRALFAIISVSSFFYLKNKIHWAPALLFCSGLLRWTIMPGFMGDYPITIEVPASQSAMRWTIANYPLHEIESLFIPFACMIFVIFLQRFKKEAVAKIFVYAGTINAAYGLIQVVGFQPLYQVIEPWFKNTPLGFMGQHTVLGAFLCACLAPALWLNMWLPASLMATCILFTGSSMAYASLWAVLSLYVAHRFEIRHAISMQVRMLFVVGVVFMLFGGSELFNPHERLDVWKMGLRAFSENPLFGGGPGYWPGFWQPKFFPIITGHVPDNPHAEWLKLLIEYGLFGAAIFAAALIEFIKNFRLTWHHAVICAIMVNALANFPLHIVPIAVLFLWCLGLSRETNFLIRRKYAA